MIYKNIVNKGMNPAILIFCPNQLIQHSNIHLLLNTFLWVDKTHYFIIYKYEH